MNPYAPLTTPDVDAPVVHRTLTDHTKWLHLTIGSFVLVTIIGLAVAVQGIESIIASGPALILVGGLLTVLSIRNHDVPSSLLGLSAFALSALVVALINLVPYSAATGYWPLLTVFVAYAGVTVPFAAWLVAFRRPGRIPKDT